MNVREIKGPGLRGRDAPGTPSPLGGKGDDPFPGQFGSVRDRRPNGRLREGRILGDQLRAGEASARLSSTTDTGILVPTMHGTPPMISAVALMCGCQSIDASSTKTDAEF